jgi:hypothetical protein
VVDPLACSLGFVPGSFGAGAGQFSGRCWFICVGVVTPLSPHCRRGLGCVGAWLIHLGLRWPLSVITGGLELEWPLPVLSGAEVAFH